MGGFDLRVRSVFIEGCMTFSWGVIDLHLYVGFLLVGGCLFIVQHDEFNVGPVLVVVDFLFDEWSIHAVEETM
jgi:hypothetical protein